MLNSKLLLTEKQTKAFHRLIEAFKNCEKENIFFTINESRLFAFDGNKVVPSAFLEDAEEILYTHTSDTRTSENIPRVESYFHPVFDNLDYGIIPIEEVSNLKYALTRSTLDDEEIPEDNPAFIETPAEIFIAEADTLGEFRVAVESIHKEAPNASEWQPDTLLLCAKYFGGATMSHLSDIEPYYYSYTLSDDEILIGEM